MGTTQPIRYKDQINQIQQYYKRRGEIRNYTLIVAGLNTALRISDILMLRWKDVYDFEQCRFKTHINVFEQKTDKTNCILINSKLKSALFVLMKKESISEDAYIFHSQNSIYNNINRSTAYRIVKKAADKCGIDENIGCHSLRKTFGYHAWKQGVPPAMLMYIYNHSSFQITKRYLGIEQDDKDEVYKNVQL